MKRITGQASYLASQCAPVRPSVSGAPDAGAQSAEPAIPLPEDLIIYVAGFLGWRDCLHMARVCRDWRCAVIYCAVLWARLDLYDSGNAALRLLPALLPLSGGAFISVSIRLTNADGLNRLDALSGLLEPHLHRVRALTVRSRRRSDYAPLFAVLRHPAPALRHLDVSHDCTEYVQFESAPPPPPPDALALAPQLASVCWGAQALPREPAHRLFAATRVRIAPSTRAAAEIFSVFPRAAALCLDMLSTTSGVQPVPPGHPLAALELRVQPIEKLPYPLSWAHLRALGFAGLPLLRLHQYSGSLVIAACQDPEWRLETLRIEYDDFVDASFVARRGAPAECRMTALVPSRGKTWSMRRVMDEPDWLRALVRLTLSATLSVEQQRPDLLLPRGALPALREFALICGADGVRGDGADIARWGSLLDAHIMPRCGVLAAPQLAAVRLLARSPCPAGDDAVLSPAALAEFLSAHVRTTRGRVPLLAVSLCLRLADDVAGMAALRAAVDAIEHWA